MCVVVVLRARVYLRDTLGAWMLRSMMLLLVCWAPLAACHLPVREPVEHGVTAQGWSVITEDQDGEIVRFVQVSVALAPEVPADRALAARIALRIAGAIPDDIDVIVVELDSANGPMSDGTFQFDRADLDG